MLPIAVDAMGGDRAPVDVVEGARRAAAAGIPIVLVGPEDLGDRVDLGGLPVIAASEVIEMDADGAQAVRRKKDSTLVRAAEAVRDGVASATLSAGNTGATMAAALLRMGRISGVSRPAIATQLPVPGSTPTILLDSGANADVQPEWLVQFARMGAIYARERVGIRSPRVGLLSIGEEPGKGDALRKEAYALLDAASGFEFVGNVEGRDLLTPDVDVVVTDGFTGNVVLKALEGSLQMLLREVQRAFASDPGLQSHAQALRPALAPLYQQLDPDAYGGAALLGVDGVSIVSHGSSGATAIFNGIRVAAEMVERDMVGQIRTAIAAGAPAPT